MAKDRNDPPTPQQHGGAGSEKKDAPRTPSALEGTEMPDSLRHSQATAQQQAPKAVKHEGARDDLGQTVDAPPLPPKAKADPVPRVIDQSERSPDPARLSRFKIRADQPFGPQPTRYVLTRKGDRQGAIDHYLETTGLKAVMDTFPEDQRPRLLMAVKELPD